MSNSPQEQKAPAQQRSGVPPVVVALAVVLCIASCTFLLLIPTASIDVDTVYQGF
jgi:hypothetical protein